MTQPLPIPGCITYAPGISRVYNSGLYYTFDMSGNDLTNAPAISTLYLALFSVGKSAKFNNVALEVTVGVATATCDLGIYKDNGKLQPGGLLQNFGSFDASIAQVNILPINPSLILQPGVYWLAILPLNAAATYRSRSRIELSLIGSITPGNANSGTCYSIAGQNSLPINGNGASPSQLTIPKIQLQAV